MGGWMQFLLVVLTVFDATRSYKISRIWPSRDIVNTELTQQLNGTVVLPGDKQYYSLIMQISLGLVRRPGAIALVENRDDIRKCILFARKYHLGVNMRSSGHSFFGRSTGDHVLLIDTSKMNKILSINQNDPESSTGSSATVQAGTTWGQIYEEVDKHRLLAVGASPRSVAVSGYLLGGGHSAMTRKLGLGSDSVIRISMVAANGDYLEVTETTIFITKVNGQTDTLTNADLFWALRGGGASFGVITEFKLKLHPAPDSFVEMSVGFAIKHPIYGDPWKDFLDFYGSFFAHNLTNNWGGYMFPNNQPGFDPVANVTTIGSVSLSMLHFGNWTEAMRSIQPLLDWRPSVKLVTFTNHTSYWSYARNINDGIPRFVNNVGRLIHSEDLQGSALREILTADLLEGFQIRRCIIMLIGGRAAEIPANSSAASANFRRAMWNIICTPMYDDLRERAFQLELFEPFRRKLYTVGQGAYYNEADYNLENWQEQFWGDHYGRLQDVKDIWDPENFFTCHMCVEVSNY